MRRVLIALPLAAVLLSAAAPAPAAAAPAGGLSFVECLTGKLPVTIEPRTPREGGCRVSRTVALDGEETGMNHLSGLVASRDGRSLYAASPSDDAVAVFRTRPLRLQECLTTNAELRVRGRRPCRLLPHPGSEDAVSGFNDVHFVAISPDGRSVYTVSRDNSIGSFARAPSGKLSYRGCITGDRTRFGSTRNGACQPIPGATFLPEGLFSGLGGPTSLTVSPDSRFVYVTLAEEDGIATLERTPGGGLRYLGCLIGRPSRSVAGNGATSPCALASTAAVNPNGSGLISPKRIVISADGTSLYATSPRRSAIAELRRDPATGALAFQGCLGAANRGTGPGDPCRYVPEAGEIGDETGMFGIAEIALDRDGTTLYGLSSVDQAVTTFTRDPATGALTFGGRDEVSEPRGLALSADGRSLLVGSPALAAIDRFDVAPDGGLRFAGCLTGSRKAVGPCARARARNGRVQRLGFESFSSLAVAGGDLYATAKGGSAITRLRVR